MDDADDGQRRIELDSPGDLAHLLANVRAAATCHLAAAFPPVPDDNDADDPLRDEIELIVNNYIDKTFSLAAPNLSINGLPVDAADFLAQHRRRAKLGAGTARPHPSPGDDDSASYEPFDALKRQRVAALVAEEEKLLAEVAALKRQVPARAAARAVANLDDAAARDDAQLEQRLKIVASAAATAAATAAGSLVQPLQRQAVVEDTFRRAVDELARLKTELPSVVARLDRARAAAEYVRDSR